MPLTIRLDPNLERRVHSAAAGEGVSVSQFVREAINERLDRGIARTSLWDRIGPSVVGRRVKAKPSRRADSSGSTHAEFADALETEAATKWRRLDK